MQVFLLITLVNLLMNHIIYYVSVGSVVILVRSTFSLITDPIMVFKEKREIQYIKRRKNGNYYCTIFGNNNVIN